MATTDHMLEIKRLGVQRGGRQILHDVSFDVPRGVVVGVVGPNGAGKSTLLSCLYRHTDYREGLVRVEGRDLRSVSRGELARLIAAVPQDTPLAFDLSVEDLVAAGRIPWGGIMGRTRAEDRLAIDQSLARVNLSHLRHRSVTTLSGGERQRALLGRALAQSAPIMVLDEPTNHLDLANQEQVLRLIRDHVGTTLVALHDLNMALEYCDRIVVMAGGTVVAAGTPADVITPSLLGSVFGVRCHIIPHPESGRPHIIMSGRI